MSATPRQDLVARAVVFAQGTWAVCNRLLPLGPLHAHVATQLFEAASGIGSNLEEGQVGRSRRDMGAKYAIALREAREARYWLRLLSTDKDRTTMAAPLLAESEEFVAMLTVSVRKLRSPIDQ